MGGRGHMRVLDTPSPQCLSSSVSQWREDVMWSSLALTLVLGKDSTMCVCVSVCVCVCVCVTAQYRELFSLRDLKKAEVQEEVACTNILLKS